jgi:hypothetical protein
VLTLGIGLALTVAIAWVAPGGKAALRQIGVPVTGSSPGLQLIWHDDYSGEVRNTGSQPIDNLTVRVTDADGRSIQAPVQADPSTYAGTLYLINPNTRGYFFLPVLRGKVVSADLLDATGTRIEVTATREPWPDNLMRPRKLPCGHLQALFDSSGGGYSRCILGHVHTGR